MRRLVLPLVFAALAAPAFAEEGERLPMPQNAAWQTECSACHMAFPPILLPGRSWTQIMTTLDDHFGENAMLDEPTRGEIEAFLVANAGDAGGRTFRGVAADQTPLRITELDWFVRQHSREVSPAMKERAGSMSNCTACHRGAAMGMFGDDD